MNYLVRCLIEGSVVFEDWYESMYEAHLDVRYAIWAGYAPAGSKIIILSSSGRKYHWEGGMWTED